MNKYFKSYLGVAVASVLAMSSALAAEQSYELGIEAQPLSSALREFAEQSGLKIVYRGEAVEGLLSRRVVGKVEASQALSVLLEGTGLVFSYLDAETFVVSKPRTAHATMQKTNYTTVSNQAAPSDESAAPAQPDSSELETVLVHGRYLESGASSAMKLEVDVRDTPYSVSAYSESFMEAIESTNIADLYKYMTGIRSPAAPATTSPSAASRPTPTIATRSWSTACPAW